MKKVLLFVALLAAFSFASSYIRVPAVDANGNGLLTYAELNLTEGSGGVYVDVEPFISVETQNSAKTATRVVQEATKFDYSKKNLLYKIIANTESIDGPSGGNALALLAYAEFTGKKLREDLSATGTIELDGSIGKVGGVVQKAKAAHDAGITLFLVPVGQSLSGGIDLNAVWTPKGMQVVEVRNLTEAVKYAFTAKGQKVEVPERIKQELKITPFPANASTSPVRTLAENEEAGLRQRLPALKNEILAAELTEAINDTRYLVEKGYYYSAANTIFLARIAFEAYSSQNMTEEQLTQKLDGLEKKAAEFVPARKTVENLEWVAAAQLRWYWAKERMKTLEGKKLTVESAREDIASAEGWLRAADSMNGIAKEIGGTEFNESTVKKVAENLLNVANKSIQVIQGDKEAENHYATAVKAFEDNAFAASALDSAFTIAFTAYHKQVEGKTGKDVVDMLKTQLPPAYNNTVWPQLYFAHAVYNFEQGRQENDFSYVANAVRLQLLSQEFNRALLLMKNESVKGLPPLTIPVANPQVVYPPSKTSKPTQEAEEEEGLVVSTEAQDNSNVIVGIIALAAIIAIAAIALRPQGQVAQPAFKTPGEKVERAEQLLLEGKISEKNYEYIKEKYGEGGKEEKTVKKTRKK